MAAGAVGLAAMEALFRLGAHPYLSLMGPPLVVAIFAAFDDKDGIKRRGGVIESFVLWILVTGPYMFFLWLPVHVVAELSARLLAAIS
jgi:hypothetical protein